MKIMAETKFNVGDRVAVLNGKTVETFTIKHIGVSVENGETNITYHDAAYHHYVYETECFASVDELIEDLRKNVKNYD